MKKILCLVICLVVLFSSVSALAEEFIIHNGIKFGMTLDQVKENEEANGFNISTAYITKLLFGIDKGMLPAMDSVISKNIDNPDQIYSTGSVDGYSGSEIYYYFDEQGGLCSVVYRMGENVDLSRFNTISDSLSKKYGDPAATGDNYIGVPVKGESALGIRELIAALGVIPTTLNGFNQWIYKVNEDCYVNIMILSMLDGSEVFVSYSNLSAEDYNNYVDD